MATFDFRAPANTYTQDISGGTVATAESKDIVVSWMEKLEPWRTNILNMIMSNEEFDQELHQWGQSVRIDLDTNLAADITNSATTFAVTSGTATYLQPGGVFAIVDYRAGSTTDLDWSTQENVILSSTSGNNVTVVRDSVDNVAHSNGAAFIAVGTSEIQNSTHTEAARRRGYRMNNRPQRFQGQMQADIRERNQSTWENESDSLATDFADLMVRQKVLLQRAAFHGKKRAGTGTTPSLMGGINEFLTSNLVDLGDQVLTWSLIEDALYNIDLETDSANKKQICLNPNDKRLLDSFFNPIRRATTTDTSLSTVIQSYSTNIGTFDIFTDWDIPAGNIYLLDWSLIKIRPFKGANWHETQALGKDHAVDHDILAISGDFTLQVDAEKAMARITGYDTDLTHYPSFAQY